jgi:hypothetical protein
MTNGEKDHGNIVPLSNKTLETVIRAWKAGKETLTLLVIGTIGILAAFALALKEANVFLVAAFLIVGFGPVLFIIYKVYVDVVNPAAKAKATIKQHAELLDAIQQATLQLTDIVSQLNDYALIHATSLVKVLEQAKDAVGFIPGASKLLGSSYFKKSEEFVVGIRAIASKSREITNDVRESVSKADARHIVEHVESLRQLKAFIEIELLNTGNASLPASQSSAG